MKTPTAWLSILLTAPLLYLYTFSASLIIEFIRRIPSMKSESFDYEFHTLVTSLIFYGIGTMMVALVVIAFLLVVLGFLSKRKMLFQISVGTLFTLFVSAIIWSSLFGGHWIVFLTASSQSILVGILIWQDLMYQKRLLNSKPFVSQTQEPQ